jgi:hypothetical protein
MKSRKDAHALLEEKAKKKHIRAIFKYNITILLS